MSTIEGARNELRGSVYKFLDSKGVDAGKVYGKNGSVFVEMAFEDYSRDQIPPVLNSFVQDQYPGRSVGIDTIEVGYFENVLRMLGRTWQITGQDSYITINVAHLYPREPEQIAKEKARVSVGSDKITGLPTTVGVSELEMKLDGNYFIFPELNEIRCNALCLSPHRNPADFGFTYGSLEELEQIDHRESAEEKLAKRLSPINRIMDPHGLWGSDSEENQSAPAFLMGVSKTKGGILLPEIVTAVASLIVDTHISSREFTNPPQKRIIIR